MFVAKRKCRLSSSITCSSFLLDSIKFCTHVIYLFFSLFYFLVCSFNLLRNYNCVRSVNSIELQCYNIENLSVQCGSHWCLCACAVSFQIYRFSCETKCVRACTWCVRVSVTLGSRWASWMSSDRDHSQCYFIQPPSAIKVCFYASIVCPRVWLGCCRPNVSKRIVTPLNQIPSPADLARPCSMFLL